jgi:hypothetical protein
VNLLPDAAAYLRRLVSDTLKHDSVNSYFVSWLLPDMVDLESLRMTALSISSKISGAQRTYQDVAALGFAAECGLLEENGLERLRDGLRWMTGRTTHVDGQLADFCTDAVSLLGISLGLRRLNDTVARAEWLATTCRPSPQQGEDWQSSLISLAHRIGGSSAEGFISDEVRLIAFSKGLVDSDLDAVGIERVIGRLRASDLSLLSNSEATIRLAALRRIEAGSPSISINHATVGDVVRVLKGIPSGLQRWTWEDQGKTSKSQPRKWHVDNEYHVQNLAWFLLSPLFPDARFEEYKSAVGSIHPRLDIVLPSLRLIIEVKFWRSGVKSADMVRELAEDASLYLTPDAPYDLIVPLIWDEKARTEEHASLISGIKTMNGIFDVVVVSRPALMSS